MSDDREKILAERMLQLQTEAAAENEEARLRRRLEEEEQRNADASLDAEADYDYEPLDDRVLFRILDPAKSPGGLHLPAGYSDEQPRGEILAVGQGEPLPDGSYRAPRVHVGDHVILDGRGVILNKRRKLIVGRECNIVCILRERKVCN